MRREGGQRPIGPAGAEEIPLWNRLQVRFLRVFIPLTVVLVAGTLVLSEYASYQREREALMERSNEVLRSGADGLANAVWHLDQNTVDAILRTLLVNPDIKNASVFGESGHLMSHAGHPILTGDAIKLERDIVHSGATVPQAIGRLVLQISPSLTEQRFHERLVFIAIAGAVIVLAAILASVLANWRTIQVPLTRLQTAMRRFEETRERHKVSWSSRDEFQYLIAAFNRMQDVEIRLEELLLDERKFLESEIERRTAELERSRRAAELANANKSQFLASMCHELRTPLNAIKGFAEMLMYGIGTKPLEDRQLEYLTDILNSAQLLLTIVDQILDLSRVETGAVPVKRKETGVTQVVRDSVAMQRTACQHRAISISVNKYAENDICSADPTILLQVFNNVVGNAIKFSPYQGSIHIAIATETTSDSLVVTVEDEGPGIPAGQRESVMQPFVQGIDPFVRETQGFGLGLFISRRYVEAHGGRFELLEGSGTGTMVRIVLPRRASGH